MIELVAQHATGDGAGGREQGVTSAQLVAQHAPQNAAEEDRQGRVTAAVVPAAVFAAAVGSIDYGA